MAETTTVARPYAKAVFEIAQSRKDYERWSGALQLAAAISEDPTMKEILASPRLTGEERAELFLRACGDDIDSAAQHFINIVADNGRLGLLPQIAIQYEVYRAEAERTIEAVVVSARSLSGKQQDVIAEALAQRLGRKIALSCEVNEALIGGAIIHAGDLVIDGSIKGRVSKLAGSLIH